MLTSSFPKSCLLWQEWPISTTNTTLPPAFHTCTHPINRSQGGLFQGQNKVPVTGNVPTVMSGTVYNNASVKNILCQNYSINKTFDGVPLSKISFSFGVPVSKIFPWGLTQ